MVGALQQLDGGTGAEVGAADADDHKYVGIAADLLRRPLDAGDFLRGLPDGQVLPAEKIVACAGAVRQSGVGGGDFLFHGQQVGQGDLTPYIGDINFNHVVGHVLSFICVTLLCYSKFAGNASPFTKSFHGNCAKLFYIFHW